MKPFVLAVLAAATAAAPAAPARAEHGPRGLRCGHTSKTGPDGDEARTAEVGGGPMLVTGDGTITCSVQTGAETADGTDAAWATGSGSTVVYLGATVVSYVAPEGVPVFLCTTVTDATGTYHWDELTGGWVPSAAAAHCAPVTGTDVLGGASDVTDTVFSDVADPLACPALAVIFPPRGDVPGVWDCPRYGG